MIGPIFALRKIQCWNFLGSGPVGHFGTTNFVHYLRLNPHELYSLLSHQVLSFFVFSLWVNKTTVDYKNKRQITALAPVNDSIVLVTLSETKLI